MNYGVILEGLDGSGKTTLYTLLKQEFKDFKFLTEPCFNDCVVGNFIRNQIFKSENF